MQVTVSVLRQRRGLALISMTKAGGKSIAYEMMHAEVSRGPGILGRTRSTSNLTVT